MNPNHYVTAVVTTNMLLLFAVLIYMDRRDTKRQDKNDALHARNDHLVTRIHNLQSLIRFQDTLLVTKIEKILNEDIPVPGSPPAELGTYLTVDEIVASMDYCYVCHAMKGPAHFNQPGHRKTPAPELVDE